VLLHGHGDPRLAQSSFNAHHIEGLDGVHIDDACRDLFSGQPFGRTDGGTQCMWPAGKKRYIGSGAQILYGTQACGTAAC